MRVGVDKFVDVVNSDVIELAVGSIIVPNLTAKHLALKLKNEGTASLFAWVYVGTVGDESIFLQIKPKIMPKYFLFDVENELVTISTKWVWGSLLVTSEA